MEGTFGLSYGMPADRSKFSRIRFRTL